MLLPEAKQPYASIPRKRHSLLKTSGVGYLESMLEAKMPYSPKGLPYRH